MAIPVAKGIAPRNQTSSMINNMINNPLYQQRQMQQRSQEGMDNRAVSSMDRSLGQDIATEQQRLMGLDRAGESLSRRKDRLDFAKKNLESETQRANQVRSLKQESLSDSSEGIEMGLGLLSLGTNIYGGMKEKKQHKEYLLKQKELSELYLGVAKKQNALLDKYNANAYNQYDTEDW